MFDDIRSTRGSDFINNFWRALANTPDVLADVWGRVKTVMGPDGELDPLTKELVYVAVSIANGCDYCIHSHTAAARAKGLTDAGYSEFLSVVALASTTNGLAEATKVPVDPEFQA